MSLEFPLSRCRTDRCGAFKDGRYRTSFRFSHHCRHCRILEFLHVPKSPPLRIPSETHRIRHARNSHRDKNAISSIFMPALLTRNLICTIVYIQIASGLNTAADTVDRQYPVTVFFSLFFVPPPFFSFFFFPSFFPPSPFPSSPRLSVRQFYIAQCVECSDASTCENLYIYIFFFSHSSQENIQYITCGGIIS